MYAVLIVDYTHLDVLYFHLEGSTLHEHELVACQQNVSRVVCAECLEYKSSVSTFKNFSIELYYLFICNCNFSICVGILI